MHTEAITHSLMDYLKRRYPYTPKFNHTYAEQRAIEDKMAKMHFVILILMLGIIGGLTMGYAYLLHQLHSYLLPLLVARESTLYLFSWPVFCFPSFVLALGTYTFPLEFLQKIIFEEKYERINDFYHITKGYDGEKVAYAMLKLFSILFLFLAAVFGSSFIAVSKSGLTIKHFYQLAPHTYSLDQITNITYDTTSITEKNEHYNRAHYKIYLNDGRYMNTLHWAFDDSEVVLPLIAQMHKLGTPIDTEWVSAHEGKWFQNLQRDN